ncbi:hypothetical protein MNBD_GAMMA16-1360 [hydrothermal vent metagenome]|uniref:Uncharacterized protein n=1 Tax=hydrothermal vent metagenome TaxID=652676 RepID=A0A3B0ZTP3_9ZZZZ
MYKQERRNAIRRTRNDRRRNRGGDQEFDDRRQVMDRRAKAKAICLEINRDFKVNYESDV